MLKKIFYLTLSLFCLFCPSIMWSMNSSKVVLNIGKIIGGTAAILMPIADSVFSWNPSINRINATRVPLAVESWVKEHLKKYGIKQPDNLNIVMADQYSWSIVSNGVIIPQRVIEELNQILEFANIQEHEPALIDAKTQLAHEVGHLILRDQENKQRANAIFGIMSHLGWYYPIELIRKKIFPKSCLSNVLFGILHVASLLPKFKTISLLNNAYSRKCEQAADQYGFSCAQSKEELEFIRDYFQNHHKLMIENWNNPDNVTHLLSKNNSFKNAYFVTRKLHKLSCSTLPFSEWIENYPSLMKLIEYNRVASHPLNITRAQKAETALKDFLKKTKQPYQL